MQIIVDGLVTSYQRSGKGKTLLFIHGWGDDGRTYKDLLEIFEKNYDCIALDLPGFGRSDPPKTPWTLDDYGAFLASFLKKIKVKTIYGVIGHSNGGGLAIRALSLKKISAKRLALLSSAGIRNKRTVKRLIIKIIAKIGRVLTFWLPKSGRQALQNRLYGAIGSDILIVPALRETFKLTVRQDIREDAAKLKLPTLLIYGDEDKATPVSDGQLLVSLISKSRFEMLMGGHFIHHDQPDNVAKLIGGFLK